MQRKEELTKMNIQVKSLVRFIMVVKLAKYLKSRYKVNV